MLSWFCISVHYVFTVLTVRVPILFYLLCAWVYHSAPRLFSIWILIRPSFLQCTLMSFGLHLVVIHYLYFFNFSRAITKELIDDITVITNTTNKDNTFRKASIELIQNRFICFSTKTKFSWKTFIPSNFHLQAQKILRYADWVMQCSSQISNAIRTLYGGARVSGL